MICTCCNFLFRCRYHFLGKKSDKNGELVEIFRIVYKLTEDGVVFDTFTIASIIKARGKLLILQLLLAVPTPFYFN